MRPAAAAKLPLILFALAAAGCQDNTRPEPSPDEPGPAPAHLSVRYVCGNRFHLENQRTTPVTIRYTVVGAPERGELLLPPGDEQAGPSTTRLVTLRQGSLQVSYGDETLSPVHNLATACAPDPAPEPQAIMGEWAPPFDWPVVAVHLHLLPDGRVLSWGAVGEPQLWDPATGHFTAAPSTTMLFCSGHSFMGDGRLLVTGGHISEHHGLPDANIFDPVSATWTRVPPMSRGRWYPTSTTLPDGGVLTLGGRDQAGADVDLPEVWTGSEWRRLMGARRVLPYYPRTFVAPNGLVFYAGELEETAYLDPAGAGRWIPVASSHHGRRDYGSAVMYRPGKVMIVGGSDPLEAAPTNTAELIDLTASTPAWRYTDPMTYPRRQFNATLLPDGSVLATGGTSAAGFSDPSGAVRAAEVWDPGTERWRVLASNRVTRVYHSTTLLLPDGRILHAGSGDGAGLPRELNAEIYSPPYLFEGPRPTISGLPAAVGYGEQFLIETLDPGLIVRATMVRVGSVTHGFDQNQRFVDLTFERTPVGLLVTGAVTNDLAPPGDYLLFILDDAGIPSVGRVVRVR
jgi:galactose oxidase